MLQQAKFLTHPQNDQKMKSPLSDNHHKAALDHHSHKLATAGPLYGI